MIELDIAPLAEWSGVSGRPLVIAGPCSAETEEQVFEVARELAKCGVDYLRAGTWKARTRPNSFEGIGDEALGWLTAAGKEYGLKTATEVANAQHVERALEAGLDALWIGARTTANPFSVQALAEAFRGSDVPVLIKNPTAPDLSLWIGAIERVNGVGVRNLAVVHRGFSTADQSRFRNTPMWNLVIELRRQIPSMPILNDPSHIAGRRDLIHSICQRAMDLGLDGLLIEAHPRPDEAWSDAAQQITPARLAEILGHLKVRRATTDDPEFNTSLHELRLEIDEIDSGIVDVLAQRMSVVERIAACKKESNVTTLQVSRWKAILEDRMEQAAERGLSGGYIKAIYDAIHQESIRRQSAIMSDRVEDDPAEPAPEPVAPGVRRSDPDADPQS